MTKVLVLGDLHIWNHKFCGGPLVKGINSRCAELLEAVTQTVLLYKASKGVTHVVQLGDFFDGPRPSAAVLTAAIEMIEATGLEWHIIAGNHDIAAYDAPTAIAPLGHVPGIFVYEKPQLAMVGEQVWAMIPYSGPDAAAAMQSSKDFLYDAEAAAVHYGLARIKHPSRTDILFYAEAAGISTRQHNPPWYFGHEHNAVIESLSLCSCGSFSPLNFSDTDKRHTTLGYVDLKKDPQGSAIRYSNVPMFRGLPEDLQTVDAIADFRKRNLNDFGLYLSVSLEQAEVAKEATKLGYINGYQVRVEEPGTAEQVLLSSVKSGYAAADYVWSCAADEVPADRALPVSEILTTVLQESQ